METLNETTILNQTAPTQKQLLTVKEVEAMTGFSLTTIYNHVKQGIFPQPKKCGRSTRWRLADNAIKFIQNSTGKEDKHAYSRENNLVYLVSLGSTCKKWLRENGFPLDDEIRQHLTEAQLTLIDDLTAENAVMIKLGMPYHQRKAQLEQTVLYVLRKANI